MPSTRIGSAQTVRRHHRRTVRVSDAGPDGALRLDGVARYRQDVATDDWVGSGLSTEGTWVVRRAYVELASGRRRPRYGEEVTAVTWCAGTSPAWAERRTDLEVEGQVAVRATALWVLVGKAGWPLRLAPGGDSARRRLERRRRFARRARLAGARAAGPAAASRRSRCWHHLAGPERANRGEHR